MAQSNKGSIPRSFIEDLLARSDIVQVINQRVPLKKAGATYKACCPFHSEKTPSFNVNPQKQFYHCFGCGASGDALKFLMEYDGLSFVEAVEQLASMSGMEVPREKLSPTQQAEQKKTKDLYDVTFAVAKYYRSQLRSHAQSEQAKAYLKDRGLTSEIAKEFVIGYAPDGWDNLMSGLHADETLKSQLIETGMLVQKDNGRVYDRFRNRIMFPIRDGRGRVIAFGGRIINPEDQPKYLNSPETSIFHKTYTLYGLYEMRQSRQSFNHVLVVEGYMDVVALAQFGIRNAVATLGTAITVEHLDILFRQVDDVVFCFDGDEAGKKAAWKALELALPLLTDTRTVKFLFLDQGEDPDSTVRKEGVEGFQKRVARGMSVSEFLFNGLQSKLSMPISTIEGQQQLISVSKPYIAQAQGAMPDLLTKVLSERVDLPVWRLGQIMGLRIASTQKFNERKSTEPISLKAKSIILQMFAVLFKRPSWAGVFDAEFLELLGGSENAEYRFFARALVMLKENGYLLEPWETWFSDPKRMKVLEQIRAIPLDNDDAFLQSLHEQIAMQITYDLTSETALKKTVSTNTEDMGALEAWFELQKSIKK
ncbi:DNA primase [Hydrogenovibrio kuenenii]|uniref:DNA primase n=1 Tax=Hydrogenovibrio kuenenii TaxID=63658 RepID=UPI000463833D|nr:DNA primase [Hydrogenovibrio kuenenii]